MKLTVAKTLILSILFVSISSNPLFAQDPVYFADANLKAAVEEQLRMGDPTAEDMLLLTFLNAQSRGIVDLTGLWHATNLTLAIISANSCHLFLGIKRYCITGKFINI